MGLNHLVPLSFHIRAGQLDHSWVSRFYNIQLALRIQDGYIYCSANEGETYLRVDYSLKNWEEISKEEAIA